MTFSSNVTLETEFGFAQSAYRSDFHSSFQHLVTWSISLCYSSGLIRRFSSTIIHSCMSQCARDADNRFTAFYFFSFADTAKQTSMSLMKSLIYQMLGHVKEVPGLLRGLYSSFENREPPKPDLLVIMKALISEFQDVFIIVDALDESTERENSAKILGQIREWNMKGTHILVTSRDEPDLRQELKPLADKLVPAQNPFVDLDIAWYVARRLQNDKKLLRWSGQREIIQDALVKGAEGIFRWCDCRKLPCSG